MEDLRRLTDKELYRRCQEAGQNARKWLKVFAGLLPEVERRGLYKKHGFHTIFEFAAKLGGMRRETVVDILRVDKKLEDKPKLREALTEGRTSWRKLRTVATVATPVTDGLWAKRVEELSKSSLEELAKAERNKQNSIESCPGTGFNLQDNKKPEKQSLTIEISPKNRARLIELKGQIEKKRKCPVTYDELIEVLLNGFDPKTENLPKYQEIIHRCPECEKNTLKSACGDIELEEKDLKNREKMGETINLNNKKEIKLKKPSRYIPAKVKKIIQLEHGKCCSYPGCKRPAKVLHHTRRFALDKRSDPDFLKPLCKTHHELMHGGAVVGEDGSPCSWQLSLVEIGDDRKKFVDRKVMGFRSRF